MYENTRVDNIRMLILNTMLINHISVSCLTSGCTINKPGFLANQNILFYLHLRNGLKYYLNIFFQVKRILQYY